MSSTTEPTATPSAVGGGGHDLNSRLETARNELNTLQQRLQQVLLSKRDQTLGQHAQAHRASLARIRAPPQCKLRRTLKGHYGKVTALHWSGESHHHQHPLIVSAGQDGNLLVWNSVTSHKMQVIPLKSSYVMAVGMEPTHGNLIACGGLDNLCTVYRRQVPADKGTEMASHDGFLSCCRFVHGEEQLLTSSGDSTCILWDVATAKPVSVLAEHTADVMFLSLSPTDRSVLVSGSVDRTAKVWDLRQPQQAVQTYRGFHQGDINGVDFMPSDGHVFASTGQDQTVRIFDTRAYNELARFRAPAPATGETTAANHHNNTTSGGMGLEMAGGGALTQTGDDGGNGSTNQGFTSVAFSRSGRLVWAGHSEGDVYAYDVLSGQPTPVWTLPAAHDRHVSCLGLSPRGEALCTGSWDGLLKIWA